MLDLNRGVLIFCFCVLCLGWVL